MPPPYLHQKGTETVRNSDVKATELIVDIIFIGEPSDKG